VIRAVLFDVGGPLNLEIAHEAAIDADIREGLAREGFEIDDGAWRSANEHAVALFAPSVYKAIIWHLTGGDVAASRRIYAWIETRGHARDVFELRPGILEVLEALNARGLKLGLVANQPASPHGQLDRHGIGQFFQSQAITGVHGYRKPDVRLFLRACEELGVAPEECVMVGDRVDLDVVPAKLLGMRTVRLRTGRHIAQEPRSWDEVPDAEATDAPSMLSAIEALLDIPRG
jgi:putative hydrolase of the HAD superfamily